MAWELCPGLLHEWQGPKFLGHLALLLPGLKQGSGLGVELAGTQSSVPMDAGIVSRWLYPPVLITSPSVKIFADYVMEEHAQS